MKTKTTMILLLVLTALAGCKYHRLTEMQQFSITEPFTRLVIISQVGDITISGGTGVEVSAEKFADAISKNRAQQFLDQIEVTYEIDNNTCTITVHHPNTIVNTVYGGANLSITGVQGLPVDIDLAVGSINCASIDGGTITNDVGDITVETASGDIQLATETGSVDVGDYTGEKVSLRTGVGNAGIHISGSGPIAGSMKTDVGDIDCEISKDRSTNAHLKTDVGDISITGITEYIKSGFISLEASFSLGAGEGTLTMETGLGEIAVNVF